MTSEELTAALIKYAKEIAPDATVIVFGSLPHVGGPVEEEPEEYALNMMNASSYDLATVVHLATDLMVEDVSDMLDELSGGVPGAPVERPS